MLCLCGEYYPLSEILKHHNSNNHSKRISFPNFYNKCNICYNIIHKKKYITCQQCLKKICCNCFIKVNKCPFCRYIY